LWVVAAIALLGSVVRPSGLQLALLGGLAALGVWTLLSTAWSIDAVETVHEAQRMLAYVAVAAALVLAVRVRAVPTLLGGVLAGITLPSLYGLGTRLFPDRLGAFDPIAGYRLSEPLGYWNGLGIFAAMGVLLALGLAARARSLVARGIAGALPVVLLPTLYFTFGRGPWVALAVAFLAAIAIDPRRLQLLAAALVVGAPAAAGVLVASQYDALRREDAPLALAAHDGHRLAVVLAVLAAVGAAAAIAFALGERRVTVSETLRRGFALGVVLVAVAALAAVFVRYGGPITLADKARDSFSGPPPHTDSDIGVRLFSFSGSYRTDVWKSAWRDYRDHPLLGSGAGSYEQWWLQHRPFAHQVRDAHSLYLEVLAELARSASRSCSWLSGPRSRRPSSRDGSRSRAPLSPPTPPFSCTPASTGTGSCPRSSSPRWSAERCSWLRRDVRSTCSSWGPWLAEPAWRRRSSSSSSPSPR
jgi:O-antigen ligase